MVLPAIFADISDVIGNWLYESLATPGRMAPMLVVVALVFRQFVLEVSRGPEEGLIQ